MKRLFTELSPSSDENEPVIKRARLLISPPLPSLEIDESINSSDSQNEHDDNGIPGMTPENMNSTCQQIENTILIISDSDDDLGIPFISSPLTTDAETIEEEEETSLENTHELIDLTEDEKSSNDIERCPICLETLFDLQCIGIDLIITPCHHVMCTLCSQELLSTSSRCPLCRKNITSATLMPYCILI